MGTQEPLFKDPGTVAETCVFGGSDNASKHTLRPYQNEAVEAAIADLKTYRSTLLVLPCGAGKTVIAANIIKRFSSHGVLFLAHRAELLAQARYRLGKELEELIGLEKAESKAGRARVVVGSIQTVCMDDRLEEFDPKRFGLIVVDEAHHVVSDSYRKILNNFPSAKVLGLTATPDRSDEKALGQIFESVAYTYEIEDAIRDGYLCHFKAKRITVTNLDLSHCGTVAGDFNQGDLDLAMKVEGVLQGVADATIRESGDLRTVVVSNSVDNAHRLAEIMNRHRPGCAMAVDGKTDYEERKKIIDDHQHGKYQYLVQVGILTEGYDDPKIACISIARPTKSRGAYTQWVGRGLRPHYSKPNGLLILDFTGNTGRHQLASPVDVLGGKITDEQKELIEEIVRESGSAIDIDAALVEAKDRLDEKRKREELEAVRRMAFKGKAIYTKRVFTPYEVFHLNVERDQEIERRFSGKIASEKQVEMLKRNGIEIPNDLTSRLAQRLIGTVIMRRNAGLASYKQLQVLKRGGIDKVNVKFTTAKRIIDAMAANKWKPLSEEQLQTAIHGGAY